ncbi:hypothetical protein [Ktedonospora formicarum]|uniref:Uncharacterized protein n=1 Tax=Ktedonospora formicarum TaxID=2778364 RepID=A0A8J3MUW1_9CHLR|nr:hypothetical protein [Ktedonospora formicarum]GHO45830.1 hypothetical protein KSX_39930 [Ktedonospora formicarum]
MAQSQRPSAWRLTSKQFIILIIGVLLTGALEYFGTHVHYGLVLAVVSLVLSLFLATKFGPWVGIATSLTLLLADMLYFPFRLQLYVLVVKCIIALLGGGIAGLAFVFTHGNYRSVKAIGIALGLSLLSLLILFVGAGILPMFATSSRLIGGICSLVLLVIMLLIANLFGKKSNQQAPFS